MSRRLQDQFWEIELTPTEQLVAQRLAWHADDEAGKCWPGIATLCAKTGLKKRATQMAIQSLAAAGHITRKETLGLGVVYFVHPRIECTPAEGRQGNPTSGNEGEGAHEVHPPRSKRTGAADARTGAANAPKEIKKPSNDKHETAGAAERVQAMTAERGRRIDLDWQPAEPLPDAVAATVAKWPPGRLDEELTEFRDFWLADAGQRATKRDWDRTWWNRLRAIIKHDKQREEGRRSHGKRNYDRSSGWAARPGMEGAEPAYLKD